MSSITNGLVQDVNQTTLRKLAFSCSEQVNLKAEQCFKIRVLPLPVQRLPSFSLDVLHDHISHLLNQDFSPCSYWMYTRFVTSTSPSVSRFRHMQLDRCNHTINCFLSMSNGKQNMIEIYDEFECTL